MVLQQGIVKFLLKSPSITNRQSLRYLCVTCVISFESSFCIHHPSLETLFFLDFLELYLKHLSKSETEKLFPYHHIFNSGQ